MGKDKQESPYVIHLSFRSSKNMRRGNDVKRVNRLLIIILLFELTSWTIGHELHHNLVNEVSNEKIQGEPFGYDKPISSMIRVSDVKNIVQTSAPVLTQYFNHAPISIDGNADFTTQAGVENWSGDGTPSNPIVIDGLNITGPPESVLIKINNTNLYFQISNCILGEGFIGIDLDYVSNGLIEKNIIYNSNDIGITLWVSHNITIISNSIFANDRDGILVYYSDDNVVQENSIYNNDDDGIRLLYADFNLVKNNIIHNNSAGLHGGILLRGTHNTSVTGNTIFNNGWYGIWSDHTNVANLHLNNIFNHSAQGMRIYSSNTAQILGNVLTNNTNGIMVYESDNSFINSNTIDNCVEHGIFLDSSSNNSVTYNNLKGNNPTGFVLGDLQAFDNGADNVFMYNYWHDWTSPDDNDDGIVDVPYLIDGSANNQDPFPLVFPNPPFHFLTVPIVLSLNDGETYSGDVPIYWTGSIDSLGHSVTYRISYSADNGTTWVTLESGFVTTSYDWDTTTVPNGINYLVKINASCSEGLWEADTSDNNFAIDNPTPPSTSTTTTTTSTGTSWNGLLSFLYIGLILAWRRSKKSP